MRSIKSKLLKLKAATFLIFVMFSAASCAGGATSSPNPVNDEPAAVTNLTAKAGNSTVLLRWTNPTAASFESLEVICSSDTASTPRRFLPKTTTKYEVTELTNGTEYSFYIIAYFGSDEEGNEIKKVSEVVSATPVEKVELSSVDFAKSLVIGWNLGNTLDSNGNDPNDYETTYTGKGTKDTETSWGMPKTTKEMIKAVHAAGFETIRIPVSWHNNMDNSTYIIANAWMARVKEVVDYAYDDGMYVIINIHHDNQSVTDIVSNPGFALSKDPATQEKSKKYISTVWTQIATTFADYDEKLIFEVLNEPRDIGGKVWGDEWSLKSTEACGIITSYEQAAIDAIRAVQGNEKRYLMVPGYAASGSDGSMLKCYTLPSDTAKDKLLLSTHAYSPFYFAMSNPDATFGSDDSSSLTSLFNYLKTNYTDKGIGVVMGEASASNKANTSEREKWAKDYFAKAKNAGIPVILWDNMDETEDGHEGYSGSEFNGEHHGWLDRDSKTWYFPTIIEAMMKTVGVTGYSIPQYVAPTPETYGWNESAAVTIFTGSLYTDWTAHTLAASNFSGAKEGSVLKVSCTSVSGGSIRMINNDWTIKYNKGKALNGKLSGDDFGIAAGTVDFYYVLTASDARAWKNNGFGIVGPGLTITSIKFMN